MNVDHPEVNYGKTGALIINLGTPDSTSWFDIRKYLKEFLSDRMCVFSSTHYPNWKHQLTCDISKTGETFWRLYPTFTQLL